MVESPLFLLHGGSAGLGLFAELQRGWGVEDVYRPELGGRGDAWDEGWIVTHRRINGMVLALIARALTRSCSRSRYMATRRRTLAVWSTQLTVLIKEWWEIALCMHIFRVVA
jgi:hypothetical protein